MNRLGMGLAVGAGYVLGRTKKMKLAFAVGTMVAGKRMNLSPRALADLVSQQLQNNPQFKEIGDQLREDLRGVGKAASGALVERQIEGLADRLHGRTAQVRDQLSGVVPDVPGAGGDRDDRRDEPDDDYEEHEEPEEYDDSDDSGRGPQGSEDDEERPRPRKKVPAKKAAAKKAAEKRSPSKEAPAKKTAAKSVKKAPAKKTAAAKSAARRTSRSRLSRGGDDD